MNRKSIIFTLLGVLTIGVAVFFTVQVVQSESPTDSLELAQEALDKEEYEESIELFKQVLEEDAGNTEARIGLASAYMGLSQYDDAINTLDEGIRLKPKETQFYYFLSLAYEGKSDLLGVIEAFEEGINATNDTALMELYEQLASNIEIAVDRHYIQTGHTQDLVLEWKKSDSAIIPVEAEWELDNESHGELSNTTTTSVTFEAKEIGKVGVSATVGSITTETELRIEEQVVEEIRLNPEELDPLSIGQEVALSVTGIDADGEEMEINPKWTSSEEIVELSDTEGQEITMEALDEGIATITIAFQELEEEIDLIIEGDNKYVKTHTEGEGTVTVSPDETSYTIGSEIVLEAKPAEGWEFVGWEGDVTGTENPLEITVESSMSVVAVFKETGHHELSLSISGGGNIMRDSLDSSYADNESITLVAQPDSGWKFSHWEGSISDSTGRIQVLMDNDKDIRAVFIKKTVSNQETSPVKTEKPKENSSTKNKEETKNTKEKPKTETDTNSNSSKDKQPDKDTKPSNDRDSESEKKPEKESNEDLEPETETDNSNTETESEVTEITPIETPVFEDSQP